MPTAAKLAAAILFAALAFATARATMGLLPAGTQFGSYTLICAGIGALVGWRVMGARAGRGLRVSLSTGVATSFVVVFWAVFLFSTQEMVENSIRLHYDGPFDAILSVFAIAADYAVVLVNPLVLGILLVGGALAGLVVEWVSRHWR